MNKLFIFIVFCFIVGGCYKTNEVKLNINCNGKESNIFLKEHDKFKCKLLNEDYDFTINSIENDKIVIDVSSYGLSEVSDNGGISLFEKTKSFIVEKNKALRLSTQTFDYGEYVNINWK